MKAANTPLVLINEFNFLIKDVNYVLEKNYKELLKKKKLKKMNYKNYISKYNNVVKEIKIKWLVIKN